MTTSFLYVIGPENIGPIKLGFSKKPTQRLKTMQTAHPCELKIHHLVEFDSSKIRSVERVLHKELSHCRTNGEWFNLTPAEAIGTLEHLRIRYEDVSLGIIKSLL